MHTSDLMHLFLESDSKPFIKLEWRGESENKVVRPLRVNNDLREQDEGERKTLLVIPIPLRRSYIQPDHFQQMELLDLSRREKGWWL